MQRAAAEARANAPQQLGQTVAVMTELGLKRGIEIRHPLFDLQRLKKSAVNNWENYQKM